MMKLWWTWLGVAAAGAMAASAGAGCGDDGSGGAGGSGGATSSSPSASSGPTGSSSTGGMVGSGGSMTGSGGGMMTGSGGSMASSSGSGGGGAYADCSACTSITETGAYTKECKAETNACLTDPMCAAISQCSYANCGSDQAGACCTLKCFTDTNASQASIDLYKAMDGCVYCKTCKAPLCENSTEYCPVFEPGGDAVCLK